MISHIIHLKKAEVRKLKLLFVAAFIASLSFVYTDAQAQLWNPSGATTSGDEIFREGNIGIGTNGNPWVGLHLGPGKSMKLDEGNITLPYAHYNNPTSGSLILGIFPHDPGGEPGARIACIRTEEADPFNGLTMLEASGNPGLSFRTGKHISGMIYLPERMRIYNDGRTIIGKPISNFASVQLLEVHGGNALIGGWIEPYTDPNDPQPYPGGGGLGMMSSDDTLLLDDGTTSNSLTLSQVETLEGNYRGTSDAYLFLGSEDYSVFSEKSRGMGFRLNTLAYPALWIKNNGQVNIGGSITYSHNSDYKLSVDGKIVAKSVYVTKSTDWPDFVFEDDYKIISLKETENYIKENKHLPDVPSAKQIEETGVDLGKMDAILLQKIEELTLHMIEMKKENDALKERLNKMEVSESKK